MPTRPPSPTLAGLAGLLLAVTACGGGGNGGAGDDRVDGGAAAPTETTASPLAALMGWEDVSAEEASAKSLEVEELTADCMREEGWEYVAVDWSAMQPRGAEQEDMELMNDPAAFGRKYGYGIVRNYELYELPALESGADPGKGSAAGDEMQDPNQPYVDSLSESEREQYFISLNGDPMIWDASDEEGFVQPTPDQMGCSGQANQEVWGSKSSPVDADVQQRMDDYWSRVDSEPRLVDAYAEWRDCMDDVIGDARIGDKPIDHPGDMYSYLNTLKLERMGLVYEALDPTVELTEAEMSGLYVISSSAAYSGEQQPIADDPLEALRQEELTLWQHDVECQEDAGIAEIRHDLEQEFAEQLLAEFPELAATDG